MLHKRLEQERVKRGLTQEEVAEKIGVARSTYANYESGRREPDLATLGKIAKLYGVTVGYLVDGSHPDIPSEKAEFLRWAEENLEDAFFYEFDKSPDEQKAEFLETVWLAWQIQKRRMERQKQKGDER